MYFEMEWREEKTHEYRRVCRAKDLPSLWMAVKHINIERRERRLPTMDQIRITVLNHYNGEYSPIVGSYVKDLQQDRYLAGTISSI